MKKREVGKWYIGEYVDEPIVEVWETFNGDLYFLTEEAGQKKDILFAYVRLYSMPDCAEWGSISWDEITRAYGKSMIWPVRPMNWENINTYEKGLFNEESE